MLPFTPPQSPRKRRRQLRESEESDGEMTIGQYLSRSDPFRTTSVKNPSPYPFSVRPLDLQEQDRTRPLHPIIHDILLSHGFTTSMFSCMRGTTFDDDEKQISTDLLRVVLRAEHPTPDNFGVAKDDIVKLLQHHHLDDIHVEILNIDLCHHPSLSYLLLDNPLTTAYETEKATIASHLDRVIPGKWHLLCAFDISRHAEKQQPAIVVVVSPKTSANWFGLRMSIATILTPYICDVEIEFLPGGLQLLGHQNVSFLDRMEVGSGPEMGCSVGIHSDNNTGTLGGFVVLTDNETIHRGFLTNYHVTRPNVPKANGTDLDRLGRSLTSTQAPRIQMEFVSRVDRDHTMKDIAIREANIRSQRKRSTMVQPKVAQQLSDQDQHSLAVLAKKRLMFEQMPKTLGEVFLTSGMSVEKARLMDWAFVKISPEADHLFGPIRMFEIPQHLNPIHYLPNSTSATIQKGTVLSSIGKLVPGGYCTKRGRTTGVTAGVCNPPKPVCKWTGQNAVRWDQSGNPIRLTTSSLQEFLILNRKHSPGPDQLSSFIEDGDSGSFVLDEFGSVNGLLYAGLILQSPTKGEYYVGGLAMCMSDVVESIRLRNGNHVSLSLPV